MMGQWTKVIKLAAHVKLSAKTVGDGEIYRNASAMRAGVGFRVANIVRVRHVMKQDVLRRQWTKGIPDFEPEIQWPEQLGRFQQASQCVSMQEALAALVNGLAGKVVATGIGNIKGNGVVLFAK